MCLYGSVRRPAVLSDGRLLLGDGRQWLVGGALLHGGHFVGEALLLFHDSSVEGVDGGELGGGYVGEAVHGGAAQEVGELGLELRAGDGIKETDVEGGAAAPQPEEGVLEGSVPGRAEERRRVELRKLRPGGAVLLEMLDGLLDQAAEMVVVGIVGVQRLHELFQIFVLLVDPMVVATMEEIMTGIRHGKGNEWKQWLLTVQGVCIYPTKS